MHGSLIRRLCSTGWTGFNGLLSRQNPVDPVILSKPTGRRIRGSGRYATILKCSMCIAGSALTETSLFNR